MQLRSLRMVNTILFDDFSNKPILSEYTENSGRGIEFAVYD